MMLLSVVPNKLYISTPRKPNSKLSFEWSILYNHASEFCNIILIEEVTRRIFIGSAALSSNRYSYSAPVYFTSNILSTNSILAADIKRTTVG